METNELIPEDEFCGRQHIQISFIRSLEASGLIEITTIEEVRFIPYNQLQKLEQLMRFHYDLDINIEGIEAITHLLERVNTLQNQLNFLKNRLNIYEE